MKTKPHSASGIGHRASGIGHRASGITSFTSRWLRQAQFSGWRSILFSLVALLSGVPVLANFPNASQPVFSSTLVISTWDEVSQTGDSQSFEWSSASVNGSNRVDYYFESNSGAPLTVHSVLSGTTPIGVVDSMPYFLAGNGSGLAALYSSGSYDDGAGGYSSWSLSTTVDLAGGTYTTQYNMTASNADMTSASENYTFTFPGGMISHATSSSGPWHPSVEGATVFNEYYSYDTQAGSFWTTNDVLTGNSTSDYSISLSGLDGGLMILSEHHENGQITASLDLIHPTIGHISAAASGGIAWNDLSSMAWQFTPRGGPSFLPAAVWVNGQPFLWSSGQIGINGVVTDVYQGAGASSFLLQSSQSGQPALLFGLLENNEPVNVSAEGQTDNPSVAVTFTDPIPYGEPDPDPHPDPSPVVLPGHPTVWVNGHAFDFAANEISDGSYFVDSYVSSSLGCIYFSLNGEAKSFTGNCGLISVTGELSDPLVPASGEGFVLAFSAPPSVDHIDSLWIRGTLYSRTGSGSHNFTPVPISEQPHSTAPVPSCSLLLAPDGQTWLLNGEDGHGTFSGVLQSLGSIEGASASSGDGWFHPPGRWHYLPYPTPSLHTGAAFGRLRGCQRPQHKQL